MNIDKQAVPPGRYVVAVSGGVDSMVLLDLLRQRQDIALHVVHVNHGIRPDAYLDQKLVEEFCESHKLACRTFVFNLGPGCSEARARAVRYEALRQCLKKYNANAIITAHHQDDLLETAIINVQRGTGWRGIAPFVQGKDVLRPLVGTPKQRIVAYAATHAVPWRHDTTNDDLRYARNTVRHTVIPLLAVNHPESRSYFLQLIRNQQTLRRTIDTQLAAMLPAYAQLGATAATLHRYDWLMLPGGIAYELFQQLCRTLLGNTVVEPLARQALLFMKAAKSGRRMPLGVGWQLRATARQIIVEPY